MLITAPELVCILRAATPADPKWHCPEGFGCYRPHLQTFGYEGGPVGCMA